MPHQARIKPLFLLTFLLGFSLLPVLAQKEEMNPPGDPEIVSVFPMGARQGAHLRVEVRGRNLGGSYAAWFSSQRLKGRVEEVEPAKDLKPPPGESGDEKKKGNRVLLRVEVDPETKVGNHAVRLVSPRGVSNAMSFRVDSDPVIEEIEGLHQRPEQAQEITFPVVVNGRISQGGEVDSYGFDALKNQELVFEVLLLRNGKNRSRHESVGLVELYRPGGSWFDPQRAIRLATNKRTKPRLTYRFQNEGHYLIKVRTLLGAGDPDTVYQLRIASAESGASQEGEGNPSEKSAQLIERSFTRKLEPERLQMLWSRTVKTPAIESSNPQTNSASAGGDAVSTAPTEEVALSTGTATAAVLSEKEPNETAEEALAVTIPAIIEGAIAQPGDVDTFKFKVETGEKLAFEIETPEEGPLFFNPRLGVVDGDGNEFLTNVHKRIVRNFTFYQKDVQPKTVYTFKLGGEYALQVRDLTSRHGDRSFVYRVLIRSQVPHAGEVKVLQDRVNLKRGSARKLTLITEQEEGFEGEIALRVENLPEGVEAYPGTDVEGDKGPPIDEGYKERFVPKTQKATVMLFAGADAPLTRIPQFIRLHARPVVGEQPGELLMIQEIPLMVVSGDKETHHAALGGAK